MNNQISPSGRTEIRIELVGGMNTPRANFGVITGDQPGPGWGLWLWGVVALVSVGWLWAKLKQMFRQRNFALALTPNWQFTYRRVGVGLIGVLVMSFLMTSVFAPEDPVIAETLPKSADFLAIQTAGTVGTKLELTKEGAFAELKDTVRVISNTRYGYDLYLSSARVENDLVLEQGEARLLAADGDWNQRGVLTNNTWGVTLEAENRTAGRAIWSAVPKLQEAKKLKMKRGNTVMGDVTNVYYGIKADQTMTNGVYKGAVVYTAVASLTNTYQGQFVEYLQCNSPWASLNYGLDGIHGTNGDSVCNSGCAPLVFAMMATALLGREVSPAEATDIAGREGQHCNIDGTWCGSYWTITELLAKKYGLTYKAVGARTEAEAIKIINQYLNDGWMIHTSGESESLPYTAAGHYIGIGKITEDGKWYVLDSYHGNAVYRPEEVVAGMRLSNIKLIKN